MIEGALNMNSTFRTDEVKENQSQIESSRIFEEKSIFD